MFKDQLILSSGEQLTQYKIKATLHQDWQFTNFPFSSGKLKLIIEDSNNPNNKFKFKADTVASGISPKVNINGGIIEGTHWVVQDNPHHTNFGNYDQKDSAYDQAVFEITLTYANIRVFIVNTRKIQLSLLYLFSFLKYESI